MLLYMRSNDLFDKVVRKLNSPGTNLSEIERKTGVPRRTLKRVATRSHDSRYGTLQRIAAFWQKAAQ